MNKLNISNKNYPLITNHKHNTITRSNITYRNSRSMTNVGHLLTSPTSIIINDASDQTTNINNPWRRIQNSTNISSLLSKEYNNPFPPLLNIINKKTATTWRLNPLSRIFIPHVTITNNNHERSSDSVLLAHFKLSIFSDTNPTTHIKFPPHSPTSMFKVTTTPKQNSASR